MNRGIIIVASATHKTKTMFFFLVQSEQGDIFKITLKTDAGFVTEIRISRTSTRCPSPRPCVCSRPAFSSSPASLAISNLSRRKSNFEAHFGVL